MGMPVRRLLKFLHSAGAAGMTGAVAAMAIVLALSPAAANGSELRLVLVGLSNIAVWILAPSLLVTVASGLLAMAATPGFQDAAWVWAKAATGILVLLGGLHAIGPIQEAAKRNGDTLHAMTGKLFEAETNTLWVLLGVSIANIALGIWRPRMPRYPV